MRRKYTKEQMAREDRKADIEFHKSRIKFLNQFKKSKQDTWDEEKYIKLLNKKHQKGIKQ